MNYSQQSVADIFAVALAEASHAATNANRQLAVTDAAQSCFRALVTANETHPIEGEGSFAIVAGFDHDSSHAHAFEFNVPDTTNGPLRSDTFDAERFLVGPMYNDTSEAARTWFGLRSTADYMELIDQFGADLHGQSVFVNDTLDGAEARLSTMLPAFLASGSAPIDAEGVGGFWNSYRLEPDKDVSHSVHSWGPMRAGHAD